jgi:hypothetical protein
MKRETRVKLTEPLLLVNLTARDDAHFHAAHVPYTGATGLLGAKSYGRLAPYIATYLGELPRAVLAMGWQHFTVAKRGGQWIARHSVLPSRATER